MNDAISSSVDILVVDDDISILKVLHGILHEIATVRFAVNATDAFTLIDQQCPDLILLDAELPDMNGVEVCRKLKTTQPVSNIPILFITSHTESGFEETVFDAGASDYIAKPLKPRVVLARVQTHLSYHKALNELNRLAHTDSLSSLANRLTFDERVKSEFARAVRELEPISIAMIDIDDFKKFNDHFGHVEGDRCIEQLANVIRTVIKRPTDLAARYGGEEFALILPNTDRDGACAIVQRLLLKVEALRLLHAPETSHSVVTISIGVTTYYPKVERNSHISPVVLIKKADEALYRSKGSGRNRFTWLPLEPQ